MVKKYTKKPLVVEALKWDGNNRSEVFDFCSLSYFNYEFGSSEPKLVIQTLEGPMTASVGDYIIRGIKNEFYACKPDVFKLTYDSVEE
jgi:hypothetical protein